MLLRPFKFIDVSIPFRDTPALNVVNVELVIPYFDISLVTELNSIKIFSGGSCIQTPKLIVRIEVAPAKPNDVFYRLEIELEVIMKVLRSSNFGRRRNDTIIF